MSEYIDRAIIAELADSHGNVHAEDIAKIPPADVVEVVKCKDCKHNPKETWFGCPVTHLSERQRPEDAWCWRGERIDD